MKIDVSPVLTQIAEQRASLQADLAQLDQTEAALKGLTNGSESTTPSTAPAPAPSPATAKRGPGRPTARAGSQSRDEQAFNILQQHPEGLKIPDIAEAMGIQPNYLYRLLPKMKADGRITTDNKNVWRALVS